MEGEPDCFLSELYVSECIRCTAEFASSDNSDFVSDDSSLIGDKWFCRECTAYIKNGKTEFNILYATNFKIVFNAHDNSVGKREDLPVILSQCWECQKFVNELPVLLINNMENNETPGLLPSMSGYSVCFPCYKKSFFMSMNAVFVRK